MHSKRDLNNRLKQGATILFVVGGLLAYGDQGNLLKQAPALSPLLFLLPSVILYVLVLFRGSE